MSGCTQSDVRLFHDGSLLYREIRNIKDTDQLQKYLGALEKLEHTSLMKFNPSKSYFPTACNGTAATVTTGISLQSSTALLYSNSVYCYYVVNVPTGYQVLAVFRRFELEDKVNGACVDYVNFYDGSSTSASLLNTDPYCGATNPTNITSSSTSLTVEFVTDSTGTNRGFDLLFTAFTYASVAPCSGSQYACDNGWCIAKELECDAFNQCEDNSDESHCTEEDYANAQSSDSSALIVGLCIGLGSLIALGVLLGIYLYRQYRWKLFLKDPLPIIQQWDNQSNYPLTRKYYKSYNDGYKHMSNGDSGGIDDRPSTPSSGNSSKPGILKVTQPGSSVA